MSFNNSPYNGFALNEEVVPEGVTAPTSLLTFDSFNCDDRVHMTIQRILHNSGHRRDIDQFSIPRAHGVRVANVNEREKIVRAIGKLDAADADALEAYIDTVKKNLRGKRRKLVTVWGGLTRVYQHATLVNMDAVFADRDFYHVDMVPFQLEFLCESFANDWSYEQWTDEITAAEDTIEAFGRGTQEGKPIIVVVFSAATGITEFNVSIDQNSHQIGYAGALNAGDVLIFDCEEEQVTLNGTEVAFTGYFPEMPLDVNTFRFADDGSARTYRATILTKHAYL